MRFYLPNSSNPIFHFVDGDFKVSMAWKTNSITKNVTFLPWSSNAASRNVFYMEHLMYMLNSTLRDCWTDLNALAALPSTIADAYFTYDAVTEKISFVAHKSYYLTDDFTAPLADPIYVYCNTLLNRAIHGIPVYHAQITNKEYRFKVIATGNNLILTNYLEMIQESSSFSELCDQTRLIFYTDMPVVSEYTGLINAVGSSQTGSSKILTDFMGSNDSIKNFNNNLIYNAIVPYRTARLQTSQSLTSVRVSVSYSDTLGNLNPLMMPPNSFASCKLIFSPASVPVTIDTANNAVRI